MFKYVLYGKVIFDLIKNEYDKVYYVLGEVDIEICNIMKILVENGKGIIIVVSYGVFFIGILVKNLYYVVLVYGVKLKIIVL